MHDGAPTQRSKVVQIWLHGIHIPVLDWPGNYPDHNPIENTWNYRKVKVQEVQPTNIQRLTLYTFLPEFFFPP